MTNEMMPVVTKTVKYASENTNDSFGNSRHGLMPSKILLVDDRRENLVALAAVLEPLGQDLVLASSGLEALKSVLTDDFAVIPVSYTHLTLPTKRIV